MKQRRFNERIYLRIKKEDKDKIHKAAAIEDLSLAAWIRRTLVKAAKRILSKREE